MKILYKQLKKLSLALILVLTYSCETINLDLQDDPNNLVIDQASPSSLLNGIQLDFRRTMGGYNGPTMGVMRMRNQFNTYANAVDNLTLNGRSGEWASTYRIRSNTKLIANLAESDSKYNNHLAIARLIEAYAFVTLVDYVGDVPYSQANNPAEFPNPCVDSGSDIYAAMFSQIDDALALLNAANNEPFQDLFFGGDVNKWKKLGNTLKYKMYLNLKLIDEAGAANGINALSDIISSESDDFVFAYSNVINPADSRDPLFRSGYSAGGAAGYNSNSFMNQLINGKANPDPRLRYYIYRQTDRDPDQANNGELPCEGNSSFDYCYLGNGYWGRDHTDDNGLPADGSLRSTYGIFPAGGAFDNDAFTPAVNNLGLEGAGMMPILTSYYVNFMRAEAALTITGVSGNPLSLLEQGIRGSMSKVLNFSNVPQAFAATQTDVDTYVNEVISEYNATSNDTDKLNIIMREFYLASFGYAIESYNGYRRTGLPNNTVLQNPVLTSTGFPRNFRYPRDATIANSCINENTLFDKVFWDNNPDGFIQ